MNLEELLTELEIEHRGHGEHHHVTRGWINIDCPECTPNAQQFRYGINIRGLYGNCWACGSIRLAEALSRASNASFSVCQRLLSETETDYVQTQATWQKRNKLVLPKDVKPLRTSHRKYLKERGFNPDELERLWEIKGTGQLGGKYKWRIFIPIKEPERGEIVSWTTRAIFETKYRYLSASPDQERMFHRHLLYGEEYARHAIIIVEGPTDVWKIGPGAVATLGTSYSQEQIERMAKYIRRVVCFDAEEAAQKRARKLCDALEVFDGETINVTLETGKDAGEATNKEIRKLRRLLE